LLARPRFEAHSGDWRGMNSKNMSVFEGLDGGNMRNVPRLENYYGNWFGVCFYCFIGNSGAYWGSPSID